MVMVNGYFATWSMIFSSKSVAQMQHSRNKHTTNHDKNSLNFFTAPLEFTTDPFFYRKQQKKCTSHFVLLIRVRKWDRQYGISGIYKTPVEVRSNGVWCIFGAFFWAQKNPARLIINILQDFQSGKGGIRTPGASQHGGFQDRCNRPLYHLSNA